MKISSAVGVGVLLVSLLAFCGSPCPTEIIHHKQQVYETYTVDSTSKIVFVWKSGEGKPYQTFSNFKKVWQAKGKTLTMATNGGMFSPSYSPLGYYVEDGEELMSIRLDSGGGNFYMVPNGVFGITKSGKAVVVESHKAAENKDSYKYATQSGPMLVVDGELHPAFREGSTNKYIRSGVGVTRNGKVVFAISNATTNFYDFATLFRDKLDCPNALYLDGAISKMYNASTERNEDGNFGVMIGVEE